MNASVVEGIPVDAVLTVCVPCEDLKVCDLACVVDVVMVGSCEGGIVEE